MNPVKTDEFHDPMLNCAACDHEAELWHKYEEEEDEVDDDEHDPDPHLMEWSVARVECTGCSRQGPEVDDVGFDSMPSVEEAAIEAWNEQQRRDRGDAA